METTTTKQTNKQQNGGEVQIVGQYQMAKHRINWSKCQRKNGDRIRHTKHNGQEFSKIMRAIKPQNEEAPKYPTGKM